VPDETRVQGLVTGTAAGDERYSAGFTSGA
jgi:hypothetical protein